MSENIARTLMDHMYRGACPDEVNGWVARDPECPACRALDTLAEQGEPEWEYGLYNEDPHPQSERPHRAYNGAYMVSDNFEHVRTQHRRGHPSIKFVRRRKAGPWEVCDD